MEQQHANYVFDVTFNYELNYSYYHSAHNCILLLSQESGQPFLLICNLYISPTIQVQVRNLQESFSANYFDITFKKFSAERWWWNHYNNNNVHLWTDTSLWKQVDYKIWILSFLCVKIVYVVLAERNGCLYIMGYVTITWVTPAFTK